MKQKFDDIFASTRYVKALETIRKTKMEQASEVFSECTKISTSQQVTLVLHYILSEFVIFVPCQKVSKILPICPIDIKCCNIKTWEHMLSIVSLVTMNKFLRLYRSVFKNASAGVRLIS